MSCDWTRRFTSNNAYMKFPRDFVQSQKSSSATWTVHTCDQRIVTPITTVQMASITWRIVQRTWCSARSWGNAFGQTSPIVIIRIINNIIMSKHCKSNFHPPQQRSANIYHAISMHELRSSGYYIWFQHELAWSLPPHSFVFVYFLSHDLFDSVLELVVDVNVIFQTAIFYWGILFFGFRFGEMYLCNASFTSFVHTATISDVQSYLVVI